MDNFDYDSTTSKKVLDYLKKKDISLTKEDKTFIRSTINEATSSSWNKGTRSNGCDCGQPSCSYCN